MRSIRTVMPSSRILRSMRQTWCVATCLAVMTLACTKPNPAATCASDGACSDPRYPYCDVTGVIGGIPETCIAVSCSTGAIGGCSGSDALVCNTSGSGYDLETCAHGCAATSGCVEPCVASESTCTAGTLTVCDGSGDIASTSPCSVGCSVDGTRCAAMVPSNGLADVLAVVPNPPDLDLEDGALNAAGSGEFTPDDGSAFAVPLISVAAADGGQPLAVLVVHTLKMNNVRIGASSTALRQNVALAVIATSDVEVDGSNSVLYPGYADDEQCMGADHGGGSVGSATHTTGAGGGGFATIGGDGGGVPGFQGGVGGAVSGTASLVPLRGGCDGGYEFQHTMHFAFGGGALQLSSLTRIVVNGLIVADAGQPFDRSGAGGGAGGAILLEAPVVALAANGALLARGAGGAAGDGTNGLTQLDALSNPGGSCAANANQVTCTAGGAGASPTQPAQPGAPLADDTEAGSANISAGGGGGGLGRIRINTADGVFAPGSGALVAGALTVGTVATQ